MALRITIIGAGPGGYTAAFDAAKRGAEVTLVESKWLGGTCLNCGCIPTKTLKSSAEALETVRRAQEFGLTGAGEASVDMPAVIARKRKVSETLRGGLEKSCAKLKIKVLEAPGHCPGSVVFYVKEKDGGYLFAGDVIFEESVGRTDLWGGSFDVLKKSILDKIYTLPDDTAIFPGHGGATSVEREKKTNPFVRG